MAASTAAARSEHATPPRTSVNAALRDWYSSIDNYRRVAARHDTRRNMCASFLTTALEESGALVIPSSRRYVGYDDDGTPKSARLWAPSLARYLEKEHGFRRIYPLSEMVPGDILFTNGAEGTYNHVMMLHSWTNKARGIARVVDNQGFAYVRDLNGAAGQSPVSYAVRR